MLRREGYNPSERGAMAQAQSKNVESSAYAVVSAITQIKLGLRTRRTGWIQAQLDWIEVARNLPKV